MSELNEAQREALLASAGNHEEAARDIRVIIDRLIDAGYGIYANQLREIMVDMIRHVDSAREVARKM